MKKTVILFLLSIVSVSGFSQNDNWYFSFSMGGTWPIGAFSETNTINNSTGFAKKGFSILLDATYPVSNHWGFKGLALVNSNSINNAELGKMLENRVNATIPVTDSKYFSFTTNDWMQNAFLAGPVYTINLGRFYWDLQLLGGLNLTYLPQQKLQYNDPANKWYYQDKNTTSTDLAWGVLGGTSFRFPISEHLNLKVGIDYYLSSATIDYEQTRISQQGDAVVTESLGKGNSAVSLKMVNGTIGFVYYLN